MRLAVIDSTSSVFDVAFGYDGQEMVYEGLSAGRTRRYVYGPGVDEPLVGYLITPGAGTSRLWYQADERGSIVRLSNDAGTGGIGRHDEYGVGGTSRFRYTGQYWLGEANLLYYRARIYDARLGRFLQPDPIGYGAGMNMYAYVGGDPVNFTDPSGLTREERIVCTGTRRTNGCGGGGIATGMSGFTSGWVGGQAPTGEASLIALGVSTSGMSNGEMRALAGEFLDVGEWALANGVSRDATLAWVYGENGFSGTVYEAGWLGSKIHPIIVALELLVQHGEAKAPTGYQHIKVTPDIKATLDRIEMGISHPHRNDGTTFRNTEGRLPNLNGVTYREYVVPTRGVSHAGPQRIAIGSNSSIYYTPDHYETFFRVDRY